MADNARGGNDSLTAKGDFNSLSGDAARMVGNSRGGNDSLTATGDFSYLLGDASYMYATPAATTTA